MKISDYGTTGLRGIGKPKKEWESLVLANGQNYKSSSTAGGSFGSGKDAMLGLSRLRTIFYATQNDEGEKAIEGVAKLVTHSKGVNQGSNGDDYRATGFFRNENHKPITDTNLIPKFFNRTENGTDIYVFGFKKPDRWVDEIISSLFENFLVAIRSRSLVVKVANKKVDAEKIGQLVDEYYPKDAYIKRQFADTYLPMIENGVPVNINGFEGVGLKLFLRQDKHYNNRVAMYRNNGMKIKDFKSFESFVSFAGVAIIQSVKLNEYLRSLEPPMHNDWEVRRASDNLTHARKVIKDIRSAIQTEVTKLASNLAVEDHTLQLDVLADNKDQDVVNEPGNGSTHIAVDTRPIPDFRQRSVSPFSQKKIRGKKTPNHSKRGKSKNGGNGTKRSGGANGTHSRLTSIFLERVIERGQGEYSLILKLNETFKGDLRVVVIGQNGNDYGRNIIKASVDGKSCNISKNIVKNVDFNAGKHEIYVNIPSAVHVVLGVNPIVKG